MIGKIAVSVAALALFSLSPAVAQDAPGDGAGPMAHHWQKPSPTDMAAWHKQMCEDHFARAAGRLAFVEAKLDVTEAQRPLFGHWREAVMHNAEARKDACLAHQHTPGEHHTILERSAMMQKRLEDRLAALRAQEPALEAFYQSLSPEQKAEFDQQHHGHGFGRHRGGMMHHGDDAHG
jgi:hypothetical protein